MLRPVGTIAVVVALCSCLVAIGEETPAPPTVEQMVEATNEDSNSTPDAEPTRQYTFSWQFMDGQEMQPRGGTSKGPAVDLALDPSPAWTNLQAPDLSKFERDRRAILAMSGPFRTSFDFIETAGFVAPYTPAPPYQSWGTEYVYVIADEGDFISLQHILVMRIKLPDGTISEPIVVKHWRQDWHYERREQHQFVGFSTWQRATFTRKQVRGTWTQRVFQVDDSPRYQALGTWTHTENHSSWESAETWRPLPRREFSVRSDYQALVGRNRHTITPTGWVQEEDNLKVVLQTSQQLPNAPDAAINTVLAKEVGLARYERISNFDWSAGDAYWHRTGPFWANVREVWEERFAQLPEITLKSRVADKPLFATLFELAEQTSQHGEISSQESADETPQPSVRAQIESVLDAFTE